MGRIGDAFARAAREDRAALVIYLCAGDPDLKTTERLVVAAAEAGADIIELGMPFSDPTADGPAIQRASQRAIEGGATFSRVLETTKNIRSKTDVPILLFGYYNPILRYGEKKAALDAAQAGADGFLVVDLPPEESDMLRNAIVEHALDFVPLVAPTSDPTRVALANSVATSFVYYVSITGVTGAKAADLQNAAHRGQALQNQIGRPVALGFGVKTKTDVQKVASSVAGVVVGSAVVRAIEDAENADDAVSAVGDLVKELRAGTSR